MLDVQNLMFEVFDEALKLGYTEKQVNVFRLDIIALIEEGKSVEEIVDIVF